jgi:class 3 adenylate cyclase/DNA-binding winged helix-turn-helix (wHTH) protein/predicted ATPase
MLYTFGECELDTQLHVLSHAGQPVQLRPKAFALLVYLVEHHDRVVAKDELYEQVWPNQFISEATLGSTVRTVRQAIGDTGEAHQLIRTVHGYGYRCLAPVTVHPTPHAVSVPMADSSGVPAPSPLVPEAEAAGPPTLQTVLPSVPPPVLPPGERKVVTVLCCAPVIPTAAHASDDLDALYSLMQAFYTCVQDTVQQYGGTLQPPMGDRVLAMFGAPLAQEDHVIRAGLAALALLQRLDEEPYPAGTSADVRLAVRIGVHTGLMVVGGLGEAPARLTALVGDVTAQAVALQEHAAPGTILCSAATARLLQGRFHCSNVGPVPLQEQVSSASAYALHRSSPHRTPSGLPLERMLSPFVGREQVTATLLALLAQAEAGRGQVVGVVGEAGMGKSRLVAEFCHSLEGRRLTVLLGGCRSYGGTTPYLPVLELLRHFCGLTAADTPEVSITKVHHQLQAVGLAPEEWALELLHFLGLQEEVIPLTALSPEARKARIVTLLTQLWLQASRQQPLLLILEDLHWSDPSSEEWLGALVERMVGAPLLVLGTYRPGYRPGWLDKSYVTQVTLAPLPDAASRRIVQEVLPPAAQTASLVPRLLAAAEGNPFFLEELARTVVEQGAEPAVSSVPATIQAVLLARLDRLPATAKSLLQAAAVIGKDVAVPLLQSITERSEESLQQDLTHLQAAEFLYETSLVPEPHYTFKHVLTQEVTYQSLLRRTCQQYHARIAQVLETQFPTVALAQPELLAQHYTKAGLSEQAIPYWQRAGQHASDRSAYLEAISHFTTGIELLKTLPETPEHTQQALTLWIALGAALLMTKGHAAPEVEHVYTQARVLCQQVGETPELVPVLFGLWRFYNTRLELHTARELGEALLRLAHHGHDPALAVIAHYTLGATWFCLGVFPAAHQHMQESIACYTPDQRRAPVFRIGQDLGVGSRVFAAMTLWLLGYPAQALVHLHDALTLAHELLHPFSLGFAQLFAAFVYQWRRDMPAVQEQAEAAVALATEQGFTLLAAGGTSMRGWALAMQGQGEEGIAQIRQGIASYRASGAAMHVPCLCTLLAEVSAHMGHPGDGLQALAEAHTLVEQHEERYWEAEISRLQGVLLLCQTGTSQANAEACFQQALTVARRQQAKSLELRAAMSLARLWQHQSKRGEARELLAPIYGWFTEGFDTADLYEAKALLDELS